MSKYCSNYAKDVVAIVVAGVILSICVGWCGNYLLCYWFWPWWLLVAMDMSWSVRVGYITLWAGRNTRSRVSIIEEGVDVG